METNPPSSSSTPVQVESTTADADAGPSRETSVRAQRSRNGCLVCRSRRVKCDLTQPECQRCTKYGAECRYPAKRPFDADAVSAALRKRHRHRPEPEGRSRSSSKIGDTFSSPSQLPPTTDLLNQHPPPPLPITQTTEHAPSTISTRHVVSASTGSATGASGLMDKIEPMGIMEYMTALNRTTRMGQFFNGPSPPPDFLKAIFPHEDDLRCFHHCMTYTLSIIVVNEERNPWVEDVAPLFLFPSGSTPLSTQALKLSMLSLGAAHLFYLQAKGSHVGEQPIPRDLGHKYRSQAIKLLRQALSLPDELQSDEFLAACPILLVHDIFAAYPHWREVHRLSAHAIRARGGCESILFGTSSTSGSWPMDVGGKPLQSQISRVRRCTIEFSVLHDVIASFTIAEPCALLDEQSYWWEKMNNSSTDMVDTMCGMHRSTYRLASRVLSLLAEARRRARTVAHPPIATTATTNDYSARVSTLMADLQTWLIDPSLLLSAQRTLSGSMAIWHSLNIVARRYLLLQDRTEGEIQQSALAVLQICSGVGDKIEFLNWPLIIASSVLLDVTTRGTARDLLKTFGYQCCVEVQVAQELVEECWRRIDEGLDDEACSWWEILQELGLPVLLG